MPQGCVLSPALFTIYTDGHRGSEKDTIIIKYADDTALVGLMRPGTDGAFARAVAQYAAQCDADNLSLNAKKTKKLVVDFRKSAVVLPPIMIKSEPIERVSQYKYLGTVVQEDLKCMQHNLSPHKSRKQPKDYTTC